MPSPKKATTAKKTAAVKKTAAKKAPSKVRIAFVGCGGIATTHM